MRKTESHSSKAQLLKVAVLACMTLAVAAVLGVSDTSAQSADKPKDGEAKGDAKKDAPKDPAKDNAANDDSVADYESVKLRDLLTTDFMLEHPDGRAAEGVTPEEAKQIEETLAGGVKALLAMQDVEGVIDTYNRRFVGPVVEKSYVTGAHALAVWTLVASGAKTSDAKVKNAIKAMVSLALSGGKKAAVPNQKANGGARLLGTYELSLVMMAFHGIAVERQREAEAEKKNTKDNDKEKKGKGARESKKDKAIDERTSLAARLRAAELFKQLSVSEAACAKEVAEAIASRQCGDGGWGYSQNDGSSDPSNVHFATLGLLASFRIGLGVPKADLLEKAAKFWIKTQHATGPVVELKFRKPDAGNEEKQDDKKDNGKKSAERQKPKSISTRARGWNYWLGTYDPNDKTWSSRDLSMTAAGVICLGSIRHLMLGGSKEGKGVQGLQAIDTALTDGLAALANLLPNTDPKPQAGGDKREPGGVPPREEPQDIFGRSRLLYGYTGLAVERAGILMGCDTFGRCEWYPLGARQLLDSHESLRELGAEKPADEEGDKDEKKKERPRRDRGRQGEPPVASEYVDTDDCMDLLFLKGYLDKTPKAPKGPVITGGGKPVREGDEEPKPGEPKAGEPKPDAPKPDAPKPATPPTPEQPKVPPSETPKQPETPKKPDEPAPPKQPEEPKQPDEPKQPPQDDPIPPGEPPLD